MRKYPENEKQSSSSELKGKRNRRWGEKSQSHESDEKDLLNDDDFQQFMKEVQLRESERILKLEKQIWKGVSGCKKQSRSQPSFLPTSQLEKHNSDNINTQSIKKLTEWSKQNKQIEERRKAAWLKKIKNLQLQDQKEKQVKQRWKRVLAQIKKKQLYDRIRLMEERREKKEQVRLQMIKKFSIKQLKAKSHSIPKQKIEILEKLKQKQKLKNLQIERKLSESKQQANYQRKNNQKKLNEKNSEKILLQKLSIGDTIEHRNEHFSRNKSDLSRNKLKKIDAFEFKKEGRKNIKY